MFVVPGTLLVHIVSQCPGQQHLAGTAESWGSCWSSMSVCVKSFGSSGTTNWSSLVSNDRLLVGSLIFTSYCGIGSGTLFLFGGWPDQSLLNYACVVLYLRCWAQGCRLGQLPRNHCGAVHGYPGDGGLQSCYLGFSWANSSHFEKNHITFLWEWLLNPSWLMIIDDYRGLCYPIGLGFSSSTNRESPS